MVFNRRHPSRASLGLAAALLAALIGGGRPTVADVPPAVRVADGVAEIGLHHLGDADPDGLRHVSLDFPPRPSRGQLARATPDNSPEGRALARMVAQGAAGNHGDLYDNRDRGHSALDPRHYPTLSFTDWTEAARTAGLDYGANPGIVFDAITVGNSSTALTQGALWRSHGRAAMTEPGGMARVAALAAANHLYVYPAHRDVTDDHGDLMPANHVYSLASVGSSSSDRRLVRASAMILAALRPETKEYLRTHGLVVPTVQMILRRGQQGIDDDAAYLSGVAHPSAFQRERLDIGRMIVHANRLRPADVPPMPRLRVLEEPGMAPGVGIFGNGLGERLFDTPWAAARVALGVQGARRYRLSVADTVDPAGRPLRILWRVLRGPGATVIPDGADGLTATVDIPWTEPYPTPGTPAWSTYRVDIAAFAVVGDEISAPAIFSVAFPPTETRRYGDDGRPLEITYAGIDEAAERQRRAAAEAGAQPARRRSDYADPRLFLRRNWTDRYDYASDGSLLGWTRIAPDGSETRFTRHGLRVTASDPAGRPVEAEAVTYPLERRSLARLEVLQRPAGPRFAYRYAGPDDRLGEVVPLP